MKRTLPTLFCNLLLTAILGFTCVPAVWAQLSPSPSPRNEPRNESKFANRALFVDFAVEKVAIQFPQDWTNTPDEKGRLVSSVSPDNTARLFLKGTRFTRYDQVQERMGETLSRLLPGLQGLTEGATQHDIAKGGLGLRQVTYTAQLNGKPVTITVEFAKDTSKDAELAVLLIRCVEDGAKRHDPVIARISQSLRHL